MFPRHLSTHSQFPSCIRHILSSSESSDSNFLQNKYFLPPSHPSSSLLWYLWILAVTYPCVFMQVWRWLRLLQLLPVFLKERLLPLLTVLPPAAQGEFNSPTCTLSLLRSKVQVLPSLLNWINVIGSSPFSFRKPVNTAGSHLPGPAAILLSLAELGKELLNDKLPGFHKKVAHS